MADSTTGLFFEIAADPSRAVQNVQSFQEQAGQALAGFDAQLQSVMRNSAALSQQVATGLRQGDVSAELATQSHQLDAQAHSFLNWNQVAELSMVKVQSQEKQQTSVLQQLGTSSEQTFTRMGRAARSWSSTALEVAAEVTGSMLQQMESGKQLAASHAVSQGAMSAATILGLKAQAVVKAAFEAAESVAAFARWDFKGGVLHAAAAAEFAALAATSSGVSKSAVQGASGGAAAAPSAPPALAPGAASAAAQPSGNITVMVAGPAQAAQWMAGVLNTAVANNSLRLAASSTMRPAPAVRSG